MNLKNMGLFRLISDKMAWHNQRQEILAQNVANADTPGYQGRDLAPFDFKTEMRRTARMEMAATRSGHLAGTTPRGSDFKDDRKSGAYETTPDGNAVVLEEQMMKISRNAMDYQTVTNIYRKQVNLIKSALTRGQ